MKHTKAILGVLALILSQLASAGGTDTMVVDAELAGKGESIYRINCTRCHGIDMVSTSSAFFDLRKFPKGDRARFFNSVKNGKRVMPAWKGRLSDEKIEALWHYVMRDR